MYIGPKRGFYKGTLGWWTLFGRLTVGMELERSGIWYEYYVVRGFT